MMLATPVRIRILRMSGDPPVGVLDIYSLIAARTPLFVLMILWYDGFNRPQIFA